MWVFQSLAHQELQKRERLQQQWLQALVSYEYLSQPLRDARLEKRLLESLWSRSLFLVVSKVAIEP